MERDSTPNYVKGTSDRQLNSRAAFKKNCPKHRPIPFSHLPTIPPPPLVIFDDMSRLTVDSRRLRRASADVGGGLVAGTGGVTTAYPSQAGGGGGTLFGTRSHRVVLLEGIFSEIARRRPLSALPPSPQRPTSCAHPVTDEGEAFVTPLEAEFALCWLHRSSRMFSRDELHAYIGRWLVTKLENDDDSAANFQRQQQRAGTSGSASVFDAMHAFTTLADVPCLTMGDFIAIFDSRDIPANALDAILAQMNLLGTIGHAMRDCEAQATKGDLRRSVEDNEVRERSDLVSQYRRATHIFELRERVKFETRVATTKLVAQTYEAEGEAMMKRLQATRDEVEASKQALSVVADSALATEETLSATMKVHDANVEMAGITRRWFQDSLRLLRGDVEQQLQGLMSSWHGRLQHCEEAFDALDHRISAVGNRLLACSLAVDPERHRRALESSDLVWIPPQGADRADDDPEWNSLVVGGSGEQQRRGDGDEVYTPRDRPGSIQSASLLLARGALVDAANCCSASCGLMQRTEARAWHDTAAVFLYFAQPTPNFAVDDISRRSDSVDPFAQLILDAVVMNNNGQHAGRPSVDTLLRMAGTWDRSSLHRFVSLTHVDIMGPVDIVFQELVATSTAALATEPQVVVGVGCSGITGRGGGSRKEGGGGANAIRFDAVLTLLSDCAKVAFGPQGRYVTPLFLIWQFVVLYVKPHLLQYSLEEGYRASRSTTEGSEGLRGVVTSLPSQTNVNDADGAAVAQRHTMMLLREQWTRAETLFNRWPSINADEEHPTTSTSRASFRGSVTHADSLLMNIPLPTTISPTRVRAVNLLFELFQPPPSQSAEEGRETEGAVRGGDGGRMKYAAATYLSMSSQLNAARRTSPTWSAPFFGDLGGNHPLRREGGVALFSPDVMASLWIESQTMTLPPVAAASNVSSAFDAFIRDFGERNTTGILEASCLSRDRCDSSRSVVGLNQCVPSVAVGQLGFAASRWLGVGEAECTAALVDAITCATCIATRDGRAVLEWSLPKPVDPQEAAAEGLESPSSSSPPRFSSDQNASSTRRKVQDSPETEPTNQPQHSKRRITDEEGPILPSHLPRSWLWALPFSGGDATSPAHASVPGGNGFDDELLRRPVLFPQLLWAVDLLMLRPPPERRRQSSDSRNSDRLGGDFEVGASSSSSWWCPSSRHAVIRDALRSRLRGDDE